MVSGKWCVITHVFLVVDRYNFVHAPIMALPGAMFTLREVRSTPKVPTVDEIYGFVKTLFNKACLSSECSLVSRKPSYPNNKISKKYPRGPLLSALYR